VQGKRYGKAVYIRSWGGAGGRWKGEVVEPW